MWTQNSLAAADPRPSGLAWRRMLVAWVVIAAVLGGSGGSAETVSARFHLTQQECDALRVRVAKEPWARDYFEQEIVARAERDAYRSAIAYVVTGERRYLDAAREAILATARHWYQYWTPRIEKGQGPEFHWGVPYRREAEIFDLIGRDLDEAFRDYLTTFFRDVVDYTWQWRVDRPSMPNMEPFHVSDAAIIAMAAGYDELVHRFVHHDGTGTQLRGGALKIIDDYQLDGMIGRESPLYHQLMIEPLVTRLAPALLRYNGTDLFAYRGPRGGSLQGHVDGQIATAYPIEQTGIGAGTIRVSNYGDAGTDWEHTTDTFLVNRGAGYAHNPEMMSGVLETLYRNGYKQYGWFLSLRQDGPSLHDLLYGKLDSLDSAEPPPAPSRVFPQAGTAMLRADQSPEYWTTGAIAVHALGATGLRRQGTFHINMHARGRLIYPWQNTQQYEVFSDPVHGMNWNWSELNKNTVVVDGQSSSKGPTVQRHAFEPEVKFYSMSDRGSRYPGVDQDRILVLTREYLLDIFALASTSERVYDYALKAYGVMHHDNHSLYEPTTELTHFDGLGYKWVENQQKRNTDQAFYVDWIQNTAGWRPDYEHGWGIGLGDAWWNTEVGVRMRMLGEPHTTVYTGQVPLIGYTLRSHRSRVRPVAQNPEEVFDIAIVRRRAHSTVYAALHEPYLHSGGERPEIDGFEYVYRPAETARITDEASQEVGARAQAVGVKITSDGFVDRVFSTIAIGQDAETANVTLTSDVDANERITLTNYAYLRTEGDRLTARGQIDGFTIHAPEVPEVGGVQVNGQPVPYRTIGGYVVYGQTEVGEEYPLSLRAVATTSGGVQVAADASENIAVETPVQLSVPRRYTNLDAQDGGALEFRITCLDDALPARGIVRVEAGDGVTAQPTELAFGPIEPGQHADLRIMLVPDTAAEGRVLPVTLTCEGTTEAGRGYRIGEHTVPVSFGVVMQEQSLYFDYLLVRAPHYTTMIDLHSGLSRCLIDAQGVERTGLDVYPYRHARFHPADLYGFVNWYAVPGITKEGAPLSYRELTNYASQKLEEYLVFRFAHEAVGRSRGTDPTTGYPTAEFVSPDGEHRLRYTFHPEFIRLGVRGTAKAYYVDFYHVAIANPALPLFTRIEDQEQSNQDTVRIPSGSYVDYGFAVSMD